MVRYSFGRCRNVLLHFVALALGKTLEAFDYLCGLSIPEEVNDLTQGKPASTSPSLQLVFLMSNARIIKIMIVGIKVKKNKNDSDTVLASVTLPDCTRGARQLEYVICSFV